MRLRTPTVAVALVVTLAAGCGWAQPGFDSGRANSNPAESSITAATVGSLSHHSIPAVGASTPLVLVARGRILVGAGATLRAYDSATCPRSNNTACPLAWQSPGELLTTDGESIYVRTGAHAFRALDPAGTPGQSYDTGGTDTVTRLTASGSWLLAETSGALAVFPKTCAVATCTPTRTLPMASGGGTELRWAAQDDTLFSASTTPAGEVTARSLASGTTLWTSASGGGPYTDLRAKDGRVFAAGSSPDVQIFDAAGATNCGGTPRTCLPTGRLSGTSTLAAVTGTRAIAFSTPSGSPTPPSEMRVWPTLGAGCTGNPATCTVLLRSPDLLPVATPVAATDQLAVIVASSIDGGTVRRHLQAFDLLGGPTCGGQPAVCSPQIDIDFATAAPGPVVIADGRVYVPTADGAVNVFSLPGDVS